MSLGPARSLFTHRVRKASSLKSLEHTKEKHLVIFTWSSAEGNIYMDQVHSSLMVAFCLMAEGERLFWRKLTPLHHHVPHEDSFFVSRGLVYGVYLFE